jgi:hypothetical protein
MAMCHFIRGQSPLRRYLLRKYAPTPNAGLSPRNAPIPYDSDFWKKMKAPKKFRRLAWGGREAMTQKTYNVLNNENKK